MDIGIVEYGGKLTQIFEEAVSKELVQARFKKKKALDIFDVLAFARKFSDLDQVVIIAELIRDEKEKNEAFYDGLADLEAETGKNIFKAIYYDDEEGEPVVKELAETFVNYLYHPEKLEKEKKEEGEGFEF